VKGNKLKEYDLLWLLKRKIGSETKRKEMKRSQIPFLFFRFQKQNACPTDFLSIRFASKQKKNFKRNWRTLLCTGSLVYTQTFLCSKKFNVASWQLELGEQV
jgi:hypothetical protein